MVPAGSPETLTWKLAVADVMSGSLSGHTVPVVYRRDAAGLVHEVWMLTEDEYARVAPAANAGDGSAFARLLDWVFGTRK